MAVILLDIIMIIIVYSSIFNFIALICSNITISTVSSLLLILIMFVIDMLLSPTANSTEYIQKNKVMDEQGNITYEIVKNEDYPGKIIQTTCKTIINFNPVSQAIEISGNKINMNEEDFNNMKVYPLYSLGLIIIITAIGIYLFNIKELK